LSAQTDAFARAAVQLADALAASASDPADAIRLLLPLAGWMPPAIPGDGTLADDARAAADAIGSNLRCAACAALAGAATLYAPASYQDALAVRAAVCGALDAEATRCGDAVGRDATYQALRDLRAGVALDLAVRGANLAWLVEIETRASIPSLAEAWTLYHDTPREPGLVASADPQHPLFMPLSFPALNQ
jgi:prophage DNA circulation protein